MTLLFILITVAVLYVLYNYLRPEDPTFEIDWYNKKIDDGIDLDIWHSNKDNVFVVSTRSSEAIGRIYQSDYDRMKAIYYSNDRYTHTLRYIDGVPYAVGDKITPG